MFALWKLFVDSFLLMERFLIGGLASGEGSQELDDKRLASYCR
jgi:hypothetical protein